jgi:hypothetical protein
VRWCPMDAALYLTWIRAGRKPLLMVLMIAAIPGRSRVGGHRWASKTFSSPLTLDRRHAGALNWQQRWPSVSVRISLGYIPRFLLPFRPMRRRRNVILNISTARLSLFRRSSPNEREPMPPPRAFYSRRSRRGIPYRRNGARDRAIPRKRQNCTVGTLI